jgi:alpha-tubulin suppressor-like RCC1 family protein
MKSTHACALVGGAPLCWGANDTGQLGDALGGMTCIDRRCQSKPVAAGSLTSVARIAASNSLTLAQTKDGSFYAWGSNIDARLGHLPGTEGDLATCGASSKRCNPTPTRFFLP